MLVRGSTQLVGLLAWPAMHSISPQMHNAAFQTLGLDWCYVPFPAHPSALGAALGGLVALGVRGANVTVPHKSAVIPFLDEIQPEVLALGAVNTLVVTDGGLVGHNTDVWGVRAALDEAGCPVRGRRALVVGAGGAARAATFALLQKGARVRVLARRGAQARSLVQDMQEAFPGDVVDAGSLSSDSLARGAQEVDLLVHATPVGMWPDVEQSPWPEARPIPAHLWVFDLVYRPRRTRLLEQALESGARIVEGVGMLVHQGAESLRLWTGKEPPVEVMARACEEALRDREHG